MRTFLLVASVALTTTCAVGQDGLTPPPDAGVLNVRAFGAVGDGKADDAEAFRRAFDAMGSHATLFIPDGTYLLSDALAIRKRDEPDKTKQWLTWITLIGQSRDGTILRLRDRTKGFDDPVNPVPVLHPKLGNEAFEQRFLNFTIDVGAGNPGATGMLYSSCNGGLARNLRIRSSDPEGAGAIGIDSAVRSPGRSYLTDILIEGFDVGLRLDDVVNGFGYENITLRGQRKAGAHFLGNNAGLIGLRSDNSVPAVVLEESASLALINAEMTGGSPESPAVVNRGVLFARNIRSEGYAACIDDHGQAIASPVDERAMGRQLESFPSPKKSLSLPIEQTPAPPYDTGDEFARWVNVQRFGAKPGQDATDAFERAIAHAKQVGAHTVYVPAGEYTIRRPIDIGSLRRLIGFDASLRADSASTAWPYRARPRADGSDPVVLRVGPGQSVVTVEGFNVRGHIDQASGNTLVLRRGYADRYVNSETGGKVFMEDFNGTYAFRGPLYAWIRFWDGHGIPRAPEYLPRDGRRPVYCDNDGATLWIHAVHAESGHPAVLIRTRNGGSSEVTSLNAGAHWSDDAKYPPEHIVNFINDDARTTVAAWHSAYRTLVEDRRGGWIRHLPTMSKGALAVASATPDHTPPTPAMDLQGRSAGQWPFVVELTWRPGADPDSGIAGYEVLRDGKHLAYTDQTRYVDEVQRNDTAFRYNVLSINGAFQRGKPVSVKVTTGPDTTPLKLDFARALPDTEGSRIHLRFSKPVDQASATDTASYEIGGITVRSATRDADPASVTLLTEALPDNEGVTLRVHDIRDMAGEPNILNADAYPIEKLLPGTGLAMDIFATQTMKTLVASRGGGNVDFDWQDMPAAPGASAQFAIRWTGTILPNTSGTHVFQVRSGEPVLMRVDGKIVLDTRKTAARLGELPGIIHEAESVALVAGHQHEISLEMWKRAGNAYAALLWVEPNADEATIVPGMNLYVRSGATYKDQTWLAENHQHGLSAVYANHLWESHITKRLRRVDPELDFNWGRGAPIEGMTDDTTGITWRGWIVAPRSGRYTIGVNIAEWDKAVASVDGRPLIDCRRRFNRDHGRFQGEIYLEQGVPVPVHLYWGDKDWTADGGNAAIQLWWQSENQPQETIPTASLYVLQEPQAERERGEHNEYLP